MSGDVDVYKFSVPEKFSADISLKCYASSGWFLYTIYDEKLDVVLQKDLRHYNTEYGDVGEYINTHDLNAGNYYLLIEAAGSDFGGPYSFSINETHTTNEIHTTHSYSAWTIIDETTHKRTCSVCQNEETSSHTLTNSIENDRKTYTCTLCGATITKDTAKDTANFTLLQILAIAVGAAGVVAVILLFVKHKKKS
jgi:transcription elongation factor Elf1